MDDRAQLNYSTEGLNRMLPTVAFIGDPPEFEVRTSSNPYHKYDLVRRNNKMWSLLSDTFYGAWVDNDWQETTVLEQLASMRGGSSNYEQLTINFSKNAGEGVLVGLDVTIAFQVGSQSVTTTYQIPASLKLQILIPKGDVYQIQPESLTGYHVNNSPVFTASLNERSVNIRYEQTGTGLYIIDNMGLCTDVALWSGNINDTWGVKLTSSTLNPGQGAHDNSIIFHKSRSIVSKTFCAEYKDFTTVPNYTSGDAAKLDYAGSENSEHWYSEATTPNAQNKTYVDIYNETHSPAITINEYLPAVMQARNTQVSYLGNTIHGFLPSMGQLWLIKQNLTLINEALQKIGGTLLPTTMAESGYFWSSSECTSSDCWNLLNGAVDYNLKYGSLSVVVLFDLNQNI